MEIYVQSAGVSQEQDYFWQEINSQQRTEEPELVQAFKHLLDTQSYSILIGRKSQRLILLVTGMKASQRKDYRGRTIRNSIAFITEERNERKIRGLAVAALNKELEKPIDNAIKEGGECGFKVSNQDIEELITQLFDSRNIGDQVTRYPDCKIGKNSKNLDDNNKNIEIIANELAKDRLPQHIETLVVVTGAKNEETLKKAGVWRGLSNDVKSETLEKSNTEGINWLEKFLNCLNNPIRSLLIPIGSSAIVALLLIFNPFKTVAPNALTPLAVISSNGQYIALSDASGKFQLKDSKNQLIAQVTLNQASPVKSVAISPNGKYVASGNSKGEVWLYRVNNGKLGKIDNKVQHDGEVLSVSIMAPSKPEAKTITIVSGGSDGEVKLWTPVIK